MRVEYNRIVRSKAMSKRPFQNGLSLLKQGDIILIEATNPQTNNITTHLQLQIPIENIDEVIKILNELK